MNLLLDMNLSPAWIDFLANAGFKAVHWSTFGRSDADDSELMDWAVKHNHIVLTADLDFGAILAATGARYPSVLQIRGGILSHRQ